MHDVVFVPHGEHAVRLPLHTGVVHLLQQEAGNGASAVDTQQARLPAIKRKIPGFVPCPSHAIGGIPGLAAHLEDMLPLDPGHQVSKHIGRSRVLVLFRAIPGVPLVALETIAKVKRGGISIPGGSRYLGKQVGVRGRQRAAVVHIILVTGHEVVQQHRRKGVIPIEPVHPGILVDITLIADLDRELRGRRWASLAMIDRHVNAIFVAQILIHTNREVIRVIVKTPRFIQCDEVV